MRASKSQIAAIHPDFAEAAVAASVPDGIRRPGTNQTIELEARRNQRSYPTAVLPILPSPGIAFAIVERPPEL
jgi:hypothetical protein